MNGMPKRVAAIVTEYRYNSHAEVILGRLLGEFPDAFTPRVEVASIYIDQVPTNDTGMEVAGRLGIPICPTIADTIRTAHREGGVHGIVIIGEHGHYPNNAKGQTMYPRRRFLEESLEVMDELGITVPIFSDKHLAYDYQDALWMYSELKRRGIPFLGGSSIPHTKQLPVYDRTLLTKAKEWLVISNGGLEGYGFHAMEVLQAIAEQRDGGETGVQSIELIDGAGGKAWERMDNGDWPEDLLLHALNAYVDLPKVHPRTSEPDPALFIIRYRDGTTGYIVQFKRLTELWGYAFRYGEDAANGKRESIAGHPLADQAREADLAFGNGIAAAVCNSGQERPFHHFDTLTIMIEELVLTGKMPFPMERTLLTTGMICCAMDSLYEGRELETPELRICYSANDGE